MPRVHGLEREYHKRDLQEHILIEMHRSRITQEKISEKCHFTPKTFRSKMQTASFTFEELLTIFQMLGTDDEKILKLMKL